MMDYSLVDLGGLGLGLMLTWKVLDFAKQILLAKKGNGPSDIYQQRIKEIHDYTEGVKLSIARGEFACAWQGRDEVLNMINLQERMLEAMAANTVAITALTDQLRRSNG